MFNLYNRKHKERAWKMREKEIPTKVKEIQVQRRRNTKVKSLNNRLKYKEKSIKKEQSKEYINEKKATYQCCR